MKLLIKQSLKTIFSSKIFTFLLMIIVIISSITYTLLQSSANAFQKSYDSVAVDGKLHDVVIQEYFSNQGIISLEIEGLEKENLQKNLEENKITFGKKQYKIKVLKATGDYANYFEKNEKEWNVILEIEKSDLDDKRILEIKNKAINEKIAEIEKNVNDFKPQNFEQAISEIYKEKLQINHNNSLAIFKEPESFKIVNKSNQEVNQIVIYDGWGKFTKAQTNEEMENELKKRADADEKFESNYTINKNKGYRYVAESIFGTLSITDPSSFQAIISPSFANFNNKRAISPQKVLALFDKYDEFEHINENPQWLNEYENNIIWVDKTPYFIIGVGTSPDFSFPIIDESKPIPITDKEAIVFTNERGYQRIFDGFRSNPQEKYFSVKFKNHVLQNEKIKIMEEIEEIARTGKYKGYKKYIPKMSTPNNIKIVNFYNDIGENSTLVQQRIAFLENLKNTINILTITTTSFLILFVSSLILLIFKSLLSIRRKKNATLLAIGFSKTKIGLSMAFATILLVGFTSVLGYIIGHFLQFSFINIFARYWTIPTYGSTFSIISLMITVIVPLTCSFIMILVLTYWDLNDKIWQMLSEKSKYKFSLTKFLLRPLKWINIKSKYVISLTISNIGRLVLSTIAGIISISAIAVGISSIGKAEYAYNQTIDKTNYSYQINYSTPTEEGGKYKTIDYQKAIDLISDEKSQLIGDQFHWHKPEMNDANLSKTEIIIGTLENLENSKEDLEKINAIKNFLKNKLQFKPLIDVSFFGFNTWDIAKKLMPENQRNNAEKNEQEFYKLITQIDSIKKDFQDKEWWPSIKNNFKIEASKKNESQGLESDYKNFYKFVENGLKELKKINSDFKPYIISYGGIVWNKNEDNEKFTYIQTILNNKNLNIVGIKPETSFLKLDKNVSKKIIKKENNDVYPLVINKFISEKHNLKINQTLNIPVKNHFKRNQQNFIKKEAIFKVVDIIESYDDDRMITSQEFANEIIGFKDYQNDDSKSENEENNFNGIFTREKNPLVLETLPLYSEIDFYIGTDSISKEWAEIIDIILKKTEHNLPKNVNDLIKKYSTNPFVATFKKINWNEANNSTFKNISNLSSGIIWIIQVISIILSILFAIIISWLLVSSNNKKIATLWTLGYTKNEIMRMFSLVYLLPIILSLGLGLPIALAVLNGLRLFVINFGSILIPFAITWSAIILSIIFISSIFVLSTTISIKNVKNDEAIKTIKG